MFIVWIEGQKNKLLSSKFIFSFVFKNRVDNGEKLVENDNQIIYRKKHVAHYELKIYIYIYMIRMPKI